MNDPQSIYKRNILTSEKELQTLKAKSTHISWIRFLIFAVTCLLVYFLWFSGLIIVIAIATAGLILFLYAVSADVRIKNAKQHLEKLIDINKEEIKILNGNYSHRNDGLNFQIVNHPYAEDLDILGKSSLYQYINRCTSEQGSRLLANNLLHPQTKPEIINIQQAVKELQSKTDWRQTLQSYGLSDNMTIVTEKKVDDWIKQPLSFQKSHYKWFVNLYTLITLGCTGLYFSGFISTGSFSLLVLAFYLFALSYSKKINEPYFLLSGVVPEISTLTLQLSLVEKEDFKSRLLMHIQNELAGTDQIKASAAISSLKKILDRFDIRLNNFAFFFLNTFLLWDVRQILALNNWKLKNAASVPYWFRAIEQIEMLSSLATLAFNHSAWFFPVLSDSFFTLEAKEAGHPLIDKSKRINNSFSLYGTGKISLITGSNMAGKSTFLRSIGVNIVLALMGAPVCAEAFTVSPVQLMSSMRVKDDLAENTSTFYAELKKLESIIKAINNKEQIFILLDEILRGTNSYDRHTGSKALIKQLIQQQATGILATHDVELAELKKEFSDAITNYHFDVQVTNDELFFDFKLKEGVCTSLNATILMQKIGINL